MQSVRLTESAQRFTINRNAQPQKTLSLSTENSLTEHSHCSKLSASMTTQSIPSTTATTPRHTQSQAHTDASATPTTSLLASTACNSCLLRKRARKHANHLGHGRMLVPVGPIRIILQIVKFKNQEPRDSINGKSHRTMQYFYIVGYVTNGDDLKLCRVSLNQHELMSWARREATKHDERTYVTKNK